MDSTRRHLIWLNAVGGLAVLASYLWGAIANPASMAALWGGVPEAARPVYTVNMFLAAGGYFLFTPYLLFRLPSETRFGGRYGFGLVGALYAMIFVPSALWLPMTAQMVAAPDPVLWWGIRIALALVALGSLGLLTALLSLGNEAPRGRALAVLGLLPFSLQTAVLDALIWPAFFETALG